MRTKLLVSTATKRASADVPSTICAVVPAHWDSAPSLRSRQRREFLRKAVTATARKIAVLFYKTLRYGAPYKDPGADYYEERFRRRTLENIRRRADALGFKLVESEPAVDGVS